MSANSSIFEGPFAAELIPRKKEKADAEFDITAMIDLVFMMNIYFLIGFIGIAMNEFDLPTANHAAALDAEVATVIAVKIGDDGVSVVVSLGEGEGESSEPIFDPAEQQQRIAAAVEAGFSEGKTAVLIRAAKDVRCREIARIAGAAAREGVKLHMAVLEKYT